MKKKLFLPLFLSLSFTLTAADYTFVDLNAPWHFGTEFSMKRKCYPWHIEADYYKLGKAKVTTSGKAKDSKIQQTTAFASIYYSHFVNQTNALSWQLGYSYLDFDWKDNPRFDQEKFHYGLASLAWISHSLENWRWVVSAGVNVDLEWLKKFNESAVYYGLLWGRFAYSQSIGLHIGFFGYVGVKNGYMLPILGIDWRWTDKWKFNAILPLDLSLDYYFSCAWYASLSYTSFGGPYRFPRRFKGGTEKFHDGIFKFYSRGIDLTLNYEYQSFFHFRFGGGWNIGGWVLIKDKHDRHAKYYKYNGTPYALLELTATF